MMDDLSVHSNLLHQNLKELDRLNRTTRNTQAILKQITTQINSEKQLSGGYGIRQKSPQWFCGLFFKAG